ncbi:MAG TPA: hypothetical protein VNN79_12750 [Actinomycetota bacterium]|nr:hypothetical protein [Actinomycetota bacterium]
MISTKGTTDRPGRPAGARPPASGHRARAALALGVGLVLMVSAACSSKQANREAEQNAKLWGTANCSIATAATTTDQTNAIGQAASYSAKAVQLVPSMATGAATINQQTATLAADKAAGNTTKLVPDLNAMKEQAAQFATNSSGDESDSWNSLSGALADCIAQLPNNLQPS